MYIYIYIDILYIYKCINIYIYTHICSNIGVASPFSLVKTACFIG